VLYLGPDESGVLVAYIRDLDSGRRIAPIPAELLEGFDIAWCEWASDSRLLCERMLRTAERLVRSRGSLTDVFAVNTDGTGSQHWLGICFDTSGYRQARAIDWLPEDPANVMTMCDGLARQVNIYTGLTRDVPGAAGGNIRQAFLDGRGNTRVYDSGYAWYAQIGGRQDWNQVFEYRDSEFDELLNYRPRLRFVGYGADENEFFGVVENRGSSMLVAINLGSDTGYREILSFTTGTVTRALTLGRYDRVSAFVHYDRGEQIRIVDERVAAVHETASALLPGRDPVVVDESWDGETYLLLVDRELVSAEYVRFMPASGRLDSLGRVYPDENRGEPVEAITARVGSFEGRDLFARLTMPVNRAARGPAVIFVPWIPETQPTATNWPAQFDHRGVNRFLAARGFIALEFLDQVELQSHPMLDLRITADLLNDTRSFLVSEGYADPDRVCAISWGPIAVASTIRYPDLFECLIVIGRTIDPREVDGIVASLSEIVQKDPPVPPTLMFAGNTMDRIGSYFISLMTRGRGKGLDQARDIELIEYDEDDVLIRYGPNRIDMLTRIDLFLNENIGR
jgi:hypothetical protein